MTSVKTGKIPETRHPTQGISTDQIMHLSTHESKNFVQPAASTEVCVEVGDTVDFEYIDTGRLASAQIVRGTGDPSSGSINRDSALAKALLDAVSGESVEFISPKGKINLMVRAIHRPHA